MFCCTQNVYMGRSSESLLELPAVLISSNGESCDKWCNESTNVGGDLYHPSTVFLLFFQVPLSSRVATASELTWRFGNCFMLDALRLPIYRSPHVWSKGLPSRAAQGSRWEVEGLCSRAQSETNYGGGRSGCFAFNVCRFLCYGQVDSNWGPYDHRPLICK